MIHFVGAGPGATDLITLRGDRLLREADVVIYAGSLVNPALLEGCKKEAVLYNSALLTLEEVLSLMKEAHQGGKEVVRLHTGDPSLYGAIREQMDQLEAWKIPFDSCPGVSSFCGAASALNLEYTLPSVSQSVIITRVEGRTKVPEKEGIQRLASHQSTMVFFLSTGLLDKLQQELLEGGYDRTTPAAIVYKATWPEEKTYRCTVETLVETAEQFQIKKTALVLVGKVLAPDKYETSQLYDPNFVTEFRGGKKE